MKIRDGSGRASGVGGASGVSPAAKSGAVSGGPGSGGPASATTDEVQLSSLAKLGAALEDSAAHISKLSSLSATVASGGYHVAAGVLSNSIIEASMQLSGNYA